MSIYSSSGRLLQQFQWDGGRIISLGWTDDFRLVCVLESGLIRFYDIYGEYTSTSLGKLAEDFGVLDCKIWSTGVVALTGKLEFVALGFLEPRPQKLASIALKEQPHCWTIVPPEKSLSRHVEVLVSYQQTVYVVDSAQAQDQQVQRGPFMRMALSPNGNFLALFTADGRLWVVSVDFQSSLADFQTNSTQPPLSMNWCGNDSVLLHWEDTLLMVGPSGDYLKFPYEGCLSIVTEIDAARIISKQKCELIDKVPQVNEDVFRFGSTAPGAILYDARMDFDKKSPKADESIRLIRSQLSIAVDQCIEAAGNELDTTIQKQLLKAASFGKGFLDAYPQNRLLDMATSLRILNALRHYEIAIPLTYTRMKHLSIEKVVSILTNTRHFWLAKAVCDYSHIPLDGVVTHWASLKVKQAVEDENTVIRLILDKMSLVEGISFAPVAKEAAKAGKISLATKLLEFEPSSASQVPLLLSMEQDEMALQKAVLSGETDLIYLALLHIKRKISAPDLFRLVNGLPLASALLESYLKVQDPSLLRDFYYQDDRQRSNAGLMVQQVLKETKDERIRQLKQIQKIYQQDKQSSLEAKMTDDEIKLCHFQTQLEQDLNQSFSGSLCDTVLRLLVLGYKQQASKLKYELRMTDKRFQSLELRAMVQSARYDIEQVFELRLVCEDVS
ncbi:Vps16, N-terminal region-domain-containing protein [Gorgonomyces haynaldii]|nr:Vps16, N-terminal region-domain-containing protein [Gorgonomyces haynaldii]